MIVSYNKYGSQKVTIDCIRFDSIKEARRYQQLNLMLLSGEITGLELQVPFELIPAQYEESERLITKGPHKGEHKRGKCIEKSVVYVSDFVYSENGKRIVEDVKGMRTKDYIIKRKLFRYLFGKEYEFREV